MSSKFYARDDDSEEEESSEEEYDSDEESSDDDDGGERRAPGMRFLVDSDSEDEDVRREIKSGKDKRFEAMVETSNKLRNHMKNNDWKSIQNDFEALNKQLEKHMKRDIVSRKLPTVPDIYIGSLVAIEDVLQKRSEAGKEASDKPSQKLSKTNAKALSAVKQRVRKTFKQYEAQMQAFRDSGRSLDDDDILNPAEEEKKPASRARGSKFTSTRDSDDDEDDDDFDDDEDGDDDQAEKGDKKLTIEEMNEEQIFGRLREINAARGRKGTDKQEHVASIDELTKGAKSPGQKAEIMLALISAQFDVMAPGYVHMLPRAWRDSVKSMQELLTLARENYPNIQFEEGVDAEVLVLEKTQKIVVDDDGEEIIVDQKPAQNGAEENGEGPKILRGDLATLIERLDDELFKAWQNTDAYGQEYVELLKDEQPLLEIMANGQDFFETVLDDKPRAARIAARRILHIYYKSKELSNQVLKLQKARGIETQFEERTLQELAVLVYCFGEERAKSQTMLCHIYNHALGNRFFEARDMLLLSHLQESVSVLDVPLQVLFNRTMAQIGLCAFRLGMPFECHAALQELCTASYSGSGGGAIRLRELLAQGMVQLRGYDKTVEQERAEKNRQVPYHMHLSLDLIETAHLVSAMLLELPNMALSRMRGDSGIKRRVISKTFQYYLRTSVKQAFSGPAENTRDHVMSAARCLMSCEWRKAYEIIASIRAWQSLDEPAMKSTLAKIKELIQVEGMRTFILTYSSFYNSLNTERLSEMFELPAEKVHSIVSKMIINEELRASWDQPTASVVIRRTEPTRLQSLALQLSQKCLATIEHNEKLIDARAGGLTGRGDERDDRGDWNKGGSRGRGRGGQGGGRYRDYNRDHRGQRDMGGLGGGGGGGYQKSYTLLLNNQQ